MYTNTLRMTGLSGFDTDTLVRQLMNAESIKYNRLKANNVLLTWKQDAYRNVASTLDTFRKTFLDFANPLNNLRSDATFGGYLATAKLSGGAEATAAKVTATSTAKEGTYRLDIEKLAEKDTYVTAENELKGGELKSSGAVDVANLKAGDSFRISLDGESKTITITEEQVSGDGKLTTTEDLKDFLQGEINKLFGTDNGEPKIEVSTEAVEGGGQGISFKTERGHEMRIFQSSSRDTSVTGNTTDFVALADGGTYSFKIGDETVNVSLEQGKGTDTAYVVGRINQAIYDNEKTRGKVSASIDSDKGGLKFTNNTGNDDITLTDGNGFLGKIGHNATVELAHTNPLKDLGFTSGTTNSLDLSKTIKELGLDGSFTNFDIDAEGNNLGTGKVSINGVEIEFDVDKSLQTFINTVNNSAAGVTVSFDNVQRKFTMEAKTAGKANEIKDIDSQVKSLFGFGDDPSVAAADAQIKINGVSTTRSSNSFEINGLRIQLNEVTTTPAKPAEGGNPAVEAVENTIIIEVAKDTTKGMDAIKKFVEEYNKLVESLNDQVTTGKAKLSGSKYSYYEPLTDEEKSAMTDKQIEQWEDKAKQGLLYRDSILSGISSSMRSAIYQSVEVSDGVRLSLYNIGIDTSSDWRDGGKLVIDEDKLRAAMEDNGANVANLFTKSAATGLTGSAKMADEGIAERLEDIMLGAIGSKGSISLQAGIRGLYSSNDNVLQNQITKQAERLSEMLSALATKETYYYNMFAKMEAAMNQSNSEMAYLQAQLGV